MATSIIIIVCSLLLSAFFSGMEIAYVSSNKIHIEIEKKQEGFLAQILTKITAKPSKFIATMLIQRVYLFNKTYLEKAQKNKELSEHEFNNLSESNAKLKCIFHMLVPEDGELGENGLNFTV